jgi:pimeloyl-ACP methyl ester carboxylesterase
LVKGRNIVAYSQLDSEFFNDIIVFMEFQERANHNKEVANLKNYNYEVDGIQIRVSCREYTPDNKEFLQKEATIFLPGWSMGASTDSGEKLNQSFADNSDQKNYSVISHAESVVADSLFKEAEAIRRFIKDKGLEKITIAGHSEGGSKAIDLAFLLQEKNPEIKVSGIILLDTVGLYEQESHELAGKFAKDTLIDTVPDNLKDQYKKLKKGPSLTKTDVVKSLFNRTKNTASAGVDIVKGIAKELKLSRFDYLKKLTSQIREMARKNPRIEKIKAPIILISGAKDPISSREKIFPRIEEDRAVQEYLKSINSDLSKVNPTLRIREKYLKENLFQESPYIRMIIPEDLGHHGLPLFRPESVAKVSLYLLERYSKKPSNPL